MKKERIEMPEEGNRIMGEAVHRHQPESCCRA